MDRNSDVKWKIVATYKSLSARRAWIEIACWYIKEMVANVSLSARRAWIEIHLVRNSKNSGGVSLSARRAWIEIADRLGGQSDRQGRSPQGERG